MELVTKSEEQDCTYRAVRAISLTGLFPGFARLDFVPEHLAKRRAGWNTLYVQRISRGHIAAFEPIELSGGDGASEVLIETVPPRAIGDFPLYAYAFGSDSTAVGSRAQICKIIESRFDEISHYCFAARTAASFAHLVDRLPEINLRAYRALNDVNPFGALQWRNSVVFETALREGLGQLGLSSEEISIETAPGSEAPELRIRLPVRLVSATLARHVRDACHRVLSKTGLFDSGEKIVVLPSSMSEPENPVTRQYIRLSERQASSALAAAVRFLDERILQPALSNPETPKVFRDAVRNSRMWIFRFRKIGDLVDYIDRFGPGEQQLLPFELSPVEKHRFEAIHAEFMERFGRFRAHRLALCDFREGDSYSSYDLSIYTRTYENRSGGIRPVGKFGEHEAVVVIITISGGRYPNEWLERGVRLKCYLKSRTNRGVTRFEEGYEANQAIIEYPDVPILVFARENPNGKFTYYGKFEYVRIEMDARGQKWFELQKRRTET